MHNLTDPEHAIVYAGNNFPGRTDPHSPYVLANYANCFPDGRQAKGASIGRCDESGKYVAGGVSCRQLQAH